MLKQNKSLKRATLTSNDFNLNSSAQGSLGLCSNTNVTDLSLNLCHFNSSWGLLLTQLTETNKTLNKISIAGYIEPPPRCLSALGRGPLRSRTIMDFSIVC